MHWFLLNNCLPRFLNFESTISKSRSVESLISIGLSDQSCFESTNNVNNPTNKIIIPNRKLSPSRCRSKYIAEVEEIRINPIVSKKGYLNFLEEKSIGWTKKYVVRTIVYFGALSTIKYIYYLSWFIKNCFSLTRLSTYFGY